MMQRFEVMDAPLVGDSSPQVARANNGMLFISGVLPLVPKTDRCVRGGVGEQAEQAFENLRALLIASDSDFEHLVSIQILVPNREFLLIVNEVYRHKLMGRRQPTRSFIPCGSFHPGALIEINAVAMVSSERVSMKWREESANSAF